jgi:hypothetical protein
MRARRARDGAKRETPDRFRRAKDARDGAARGVL